MRCSRKRKKGRWCISSFQKQLKKGKEGEKDVLLKFPNLEANTKDRKGDLIDPSTGQKIEVKTSYRGKERTDYIVELRDIYANGRIVPAGPWQAQANNVSQFLWFFKHTEEFHWFDTLELVNELNKIIHKYKVIDGSSRGGSNTWKGQYCFVPREDLQHLASYQVFK